MKKGFKTYDKLAFAASVSGNKKIGNAATTYAAELTCPIICPHHTKNGGGCYGNAGMVQLQIKRLNTAGTPVEAAVDEAISIYNLNRELDLRLHTYGDARTNPAAKVLASASDWYMENGKKVWTYTHAWKGKHRVKRESWGKVSVLASCETPKDVKKAHEWGWATSIVVGEFKDTKLYEENGIKILPCPEMTGKAKSCVDCRLCFDDKYLHKNKITIGFAAHGVQKKKVLETLRVLNGG